jgi:nicotinate phosphoribosyltransferase
MLKPVMRNGEAEPLPTLKETIAYANEQMETLWPEYKRLMNPNIMEVNLSDKLQALKTQIIEDDLKNR